MRNDEELIALLHGAFEVPFSVDRAWDRGYGEQLLIVGQARNTDINMRMLYIDGIRRKAKANENIGHVFGHADSETFWRYVKGNPLTLQDYKNKFYDQGYISREETVRLGKIIFHDAGGDWEKLASPEVTMDDPVHPFATFLA